MLRRRPSHLSRVFFGGNGPIHWRTTCAQAYAGVIFCGRVPTRAYAGGLLSRNAFANALVFNLLETRIATSSWPHLSFMAHLPLHGRIFPLIFPFIGTSSSSRAHLPFRQVGGGAWAGHGLLPRELPRGFRRDTRGTLSEKRRIKFMARLHTLSFPRFAYADCLREDYREASAKCLRVPTQTCKYQCFGFRRVNMSSPHKKVPSFQKKTWLICGFSHREVPPMSPTPEIGAG